MQVAEESGGEDIAGSGRVYFVCWISGKAFGLAMLEERCAVSSIGSYKQGNVHTPTGQNSVSVNTIAVCEGQQVIVAQNENIKMGQDSLSIVPGCRPDAAIGIPAAQPALGSSGDNAPRSARKERSQ